jgi:hypothetical protein
MLSDHASWLLLCDSRLLLSTVGVGFHKFSKNEDRANTRIVSSASVGRSFNVSVIKVVHHPRWYGTFYYCQADLLGVSGMAGRTQTVLDLRHLVEHPGVRFNSSLIRIVLSYA